jgi:hypothetical protein
MKKLFYIGTIGLALFEIANVYFIMPMPGSQRMNSLDLAYFLYSYRWYFRVVFGLVAVVGVVPTFKTSKRKWVPALVAVLALVIIYMFNFKMVADQMFKQPANLVFKPQLGNTLTDSSIVVGVENNGEVKAYPIRFIGYHHQVQDNVGGKPMIVTYCTVCRAGRVFEPTVKGKQEKFRLVGMDHFNAMFEDETTHSWWRQVNGVAVTGQLKGETLPEVESFQMNVGQLFKLYPNALVMQADEVAVQDVKYDSLAKYERGKSKSNLTRTDSLSWKEKSWVIGIEIGGASKAYDWIEIKLKRIVNDKIGNTPVVIAVSNDGQSFAAFERPAGSSEFLIRNDTLFSDNVAYNFSGRDFAGTGQPLKRVRAYQEFWHSWQTFHPETEQYRPNVID